MPDADGDAERRSAYVEVIQRFVESLDIVAERVDQVLDPATARVIALVSADLRELSELITR
jgi:hypothetical protein